MAIKRSTPKPGKDQPQPEASPSESTPILQPTAIAEDLEGVEDSIRPQRLGKY
jgi:hypothetical protein